MSGFSREVLKWIQSLDLTWQLKTPKWDLTNGYLVAEIFSWYYPQEVQMHMYNNGTSLDSKLRNWSLLKNFIKSHKLDIPEDYVEGTIHCKEGAALLFIERLYEVLTNRQLRKSPNEELDFTDRSYQVRLPLHARSTASQSVKNNLRITELMADKSIILCQQKAQHIINQHIEHRREERCEFPDRFDKKPTLGDLAIRHPPYPQSAEPCTSEDSPRSKSRSVKLVDGKSKASGRSSCRSPVRQSASRESATMFKEVEVKQTTQQSLAAGC